MWLKIIAGIDAFSERVGKMTSWLALIMILIGAFNALARFLSRFIGINMSSNTLVELQWYLFSALFLMGAGYALKHNAHVRVDVVYGALSPRNKAWLNLVGTVVFLIPFSVFMITISMPALISSWQVLEVSPDPGGLPRYPLKTLLPISFVFLILQGIAEFLRNVAMLRGDLPFEEEEVHLNEAT